MELKKLFLLTWNIGKVECLTRLPAQCLVRMRFFSKNPDYCGSMRMATETGLMEINAFVENNFIVNRKCFELECV